MYIAFEGIVGAGKSTQVRRLVEYLESVIARNEAILWYQVPGLPRRFSQEQKNSSQGQKPRVVQVREPGSTPIAEDIRHLAQAKDWDNETMHPLTNAYLYAAARAQTLHTVVKPALERGDTVISDRCFLSSCAIQGEAQGLGVNRVIWINKEAVEKMLPDIIFYLDIDIDLALSRTFDEGGDKFEKEGREFYKKIIRGYEKCAKWKKLEGRFLTIDANKTEDEVFEQILSFVKPILGL